MQTAVFVATTWKFMYVPASHTAEPEPATVEVMETIAEEVATVTALATLAVAPIVLLFATVDVPIVSVRAARPAPV